MNSGVRMPCGKQPAHGGSAQSGSNSTQLALPSEPLTPVDDSQPVAPSRLQGHTSRMGMCNASVVAVVIGMQMCDKMPLAIQGAWGNCALWVEDEAVKVQHMYRRGPRTGQS